MWLRKVPLELLTSRINHLPFSCQNSQCLLLTTLLLNPTGAEDGALAGTGAWFSLSEYRPTLMTSLPVGSVREMGVKESDCRFDRGS